MAIGRDNQSSSSPRSDRAISPNTIDFRCKISNHGVLPPDLIREILQKLPLKSLCRASCVSIDWLHYIKQNFRRSRRGPLVVQEKPANPHGPHSLSLSTIDCHTALAGFLWQSTEERIRVVRNSVRGLLLYQVEDSLKNLDLCLCNPATEERPLILPRDAQSSQCMGDAHAPGFDLGYDQSKNEFKVVLFASFPICGIFTVGKSNSCRIFTSKSLHGCRGPSGSSVCIQGRLFWSDGDLYNKKIVAFDLCEERFTSGEARLFTLFELDNHLCTYDITFSKQTINVSMLNGKKWAMMAVIKIPCPSVYYLMPQSVQKGKIIVARASGNSRTAVFYSFITGTVSSLKIDGLENGFIPINYEKNLTKLQALGF